jgi:archaellum biogenesis ATPase FlaH
MENFNLADQLIQDENKKKQSEILSSLETWESIRAMDIAIEWIVDRLIPKDSITILFGKGGIGKTWLSMDMARSIASGIPFLGLGTVKTPVIFVDFENPLAVLNTRTQKLGEADDVFFWRANNDKIKAPKLDKDDWELYKQLPEGAILIFDTLRASQDRDENKSNEMGLIMGRLKELRDMGFTIILLHHTAKNSDKIAKGSTAIVDLADHILGLTLVRKKRDGQEIIVDDEDSDGDLVYRFGVREKTRFEPYQIYLTLNPDRGFELAPDPQEDTLKEMFECLSEHDFINKTDFLRECKTKIGLGEKKIRRLFDIGQGRYWKVEKAGSHNTQMVTPIQFGSLATLYSNAELQNRNPVWQGEEKTNTSKTQQTIKNSEFGSFAKDFCKSEKQAVIEVEDIL